MSSPPVISTSRLLLVPLLEETLEALIVGDRAAARASQDLDFTAEFVDSLGYELLKVQLSGVRRRGAEGGWFVRAVLRKDDAVLIGDCGFHGVPQDVGRAEIGYRILPRYRGNGYASEVASGLVYWAREQGVPAVFAAVKTTNVASLRVVDKAGFTRVDAPTAETDPDEFVFKFDF